MTVRKVFLKIICVHSKHLNPNLLNLLGGNFVGISEKPLKTQQL